MGSLSLCFLLLFMVTAVMVAEGVPNKPKKVKCYDWRYRNCFLKKLYCPASCLRTCVVNCATCQPVCTPPPPPPPRVRWPRRSPPPPAKAYPSSPPITSTPPPPITSTPPITYTPPPIVISTPPSWYTPPPPPASSGPSSDSSPVKRVKCKNQNNPHCYGMELNCPSDCPSQCEVDCITCSPVCNCNRPRAVCQDPRFIGGDGITFYFHGKKDRDFCLVSDVRINPVKWASIN